MANRASLESNARYTNVKSVRGNELRSTSGANPVILFGS